jgi:hypothetical protein
MGLALVFATSAYGATTLTLTVDGDASASQGATVNFTIEGLLSDDASEGLALWGATVDAGITLTMAEPADGSMDSFVKNAGLTNPAGYGGTLIGTAYVQTGGAQNTINNSGTPNYPVGAVVTGIGNGSAAVLVEGSFVMPDSNVTITVSDCFANVILLGETGPVYAVAAATVDCTDTHTVTLDVGNPPAFEGAASVGAHAGVGNAPLAVGLTGGTIEPRSFESLSQGNLFVEADFDADITAASVVVTEVGTANTLNVNTSIAADIVTVDFLDTPAGHTCYTFDFTGTTSAGGTLESPADTDFCICYHEADIDQSGTVAGLDSAKVVAPNNWLLTADVAADFLADVDRDGTVAGLDSAKVVSPLNWLETLTNACP